MSELLRIVNDLKSETDLDEVRSGTEPSTVPGLHCTGRFQVALAPSNILQLPLLTNAVRT